MKKKRGIWRSLKLKTKLLLAYGVLTLVLITVLVLFAFSVFSASLKQKILYSANKSFSQTYDFLDYKFSRLSDVTEQICSDIVLREKLGESHKNSSIKNEYWDLLEIRELLQKYQKSDTISRIRLYVDDNWLYSADQVNVFGVNDANDTKWFEKLKAWNDSVYPCSAEELGEVGENPVLAFAGKVKSISNYNEVAGYVRVDISKSSVEDILGKADATKESSTYLIDNDGQIVAASKGTKIPLSVINRKEARKQYIDDNTGFFEQKVEDVNYLISENYLYYSGWTMVTVIPYEEVMQEIWNMQLKFLGVVLLGALFVGIIIYWVARSITRRVEYLAEHMKMVQRGENNLFVGDGGEDEIGDLYKNFDFMIEKTQNLIEEKYELGKNVKNAELKALQSQINPHFLYNTLDMIKWYSYSGKTEEIDIIVSELARFYKLTLNRGKEIVTVKEEMEHIKAYITIQNFRFDGMIETYFQVPEELMNCRIPKITLQPLVENSILHGIQEKEEPSGTIKLIGEIREDEAVLLLSDNGVGIEKEMLDKILSGKLHSNGGSSFGVRNIHERLQMLYGEKCGLIFQSEYGKGTTVEIHLQKNP